MRPGGESGFRNPPSCDTSCIKILAIHMGVLSRRDFLAGATAVPAALQAAPHPNILFIMVDEMRWDAMGCEKHPVVETPNLDRLAKQGVRFANSYTVSPVCSPASRARVWSPLAVSPPSPCDGG